MELAGRAFDGAMQRSSAEFLAAIGITQETRGDARRLVRLGALLHDVGHAPFSHGAEPLFRPRNGGRVDHEDLTVQLILDSEIADILGENPVESAPPQAVAAVAVGPAHLKIDNPVIKLLSDLVTGTLGVDRMDYLLRDSYFTGVEYGRFDLNRIVSTIRIARGPEEEPVWALEEGGTYVAEQLLMARYFMTLQVYFHPTRRVLDYHMREFLRSWLDDGLLPTDTEGLGRFHRRPRLIDAAEGVLDLVEDALARSAADLHVRCRQRSRDDGARARFSPPRSDSG